VPQALARRAVATHTPHSSGTRRTRPARASCSTPRRTCALPTASLHRSRARLAGCDTDMGRTTKRHFVMRAIARGKLRGGPFRYVRGRRRRGYRSRVGSTDGVWEVGSVCPRCASGANREWAATWEIKNMLACTLRGLDQEAAAAWGERDAETAQGQGFNRCEAAEICASNLATVLTNIKRGRWVEWEKAPGRKRAISPVVQ
jgi:hypothetical protein